MANRGIFAVHHVDVDDRADRTVFINRIELMRAGHGDLRGSVSGTGLTFQIPGVLHLARVTAAGGGDQLTAKKLDTGAATLPAQVVMRARPTSVTGPTDVLRRFPLVTPHEQATRATSSLPVAVFSIAGGSGCDSHTAFDMARWQTHSDASVEDIVLREGEGVGVFLDEERPSLARWGVFVVNIRVVATGATYIYRVPWTSADSTALPLLTLMNESGSGVVLQVRLLYEETVAADVGSLLTVIGDFAGHNYSYYTAVMRAGVAEAMLARVGAGGGILEGQPAALTPVTHDSAKSLNGAVRAFAGPLWGLTEAVDRSQDLLINWQYMSNTTQSTALTTVGAVSPGAHVLATQFLAQRPLPGVRYKDAWAMPEWQRGRAFPLRPGEALVGYGWPVASSYPQSSVYHHFDVLVTGWLEETAKSKRPTYALGV